MKNLHEIDVYPRLSLPVRSARACELILENGHSVLDLYGGHCVNTLGAGDAGLRAVLLAQWDSLSFATNLLDHEPRRRFLAAFAPNLPPGAWQVFCANSGAEANENALKIALKATGRARVVAFRGAFHGRTAGASAVTDGKRWCADPFEVARAEWGSAAEIGRAHV